MGRCVLAAYVSYCCSQYASTAAVVYHLGMGGRQRLEFVRSSITHAPGAAPCPAVLAPNARPVDRPCNPGFAPNRPDSSSRPYLWQKLEPVPTPHRRPVTLLPQPPRTPTSRFTCSRSHATGWGGRASRSARRAACSSAPQTRGWRRGYTIRRWGGARPLRPCSVVISPKSAEPCRMPSAAATVRLTPAQQYSQA